MKYLYRDYDPGIGRWLSRDPIEEAGVLDLYGMVGNDPLNRIDFLGLADTKLHHVIPEWLARYSAYGAKGQCFCIRLTTDFHRLRTGFNREAQLTQIRNQLQSGLINQAQAYNQVLMIHLRNNGRAGGISGGSAIAFQGAVRPGLAQVGYFTYGQAALGATGIGLVSSGAYFGYDTSTQIADLDNCVLEEEGDIDAYNRQIDLARRASDRDIALVPNATSGLIQCSNQQGQSACADRFKRAMNRTCFFIETIGASQLGTSSRQARDTISEQLFGDYLQCLKKAGCCIPGCN